jgi:predicted DCC family thiol-disulfide oxidoreductase YuxK
MTKDTRVLYNETCPICRFEVEGYRRMTEATGKPISYQGLSHAAEWGLTPDQAARRFHVMQDGQLLSGLPAFRALWQQMPRFQFLARLTALPVIAPVAGAVYDHILAPLLYRAHLRRQNRAAGTGPKDLRPGS